VLAGKGILNVDDTLHHSLELFPKKPFEETRFLKTAGSSSSAGNSSDNLMPRYFKLDFPRFDGKKDPLPWLSLCEQYFRAQRTDAPQKILLATFHLDGDAFHWYVHLERSRGTPSREEFVEFYNVRFEPPIRSNPLGGLQLLRQIGTVAEYQSRFLNLLSRADPLSDRQERQMFTSGLHNDIRVDVELQDLRGLGASPCVDTGLREEGSANHATLGLLPGVQATATTSCTGTTSCGLHTDPHDLTPHANGDDGTPPLGIVLQL
jgi:hypothetical protein